MAERSTKPWALARSSAVGRASRSAREWVSMSEAMPLARLRRVSASACSTRPAAPRNARHSSSMMAR